MKYSPSEIAKIPLKAAAEHGRIRRSQGFSAAMLVEEYNLLRRVISSLAEKHVSELKRELLVYHLGQLSEALDLQLQSALPAFLGEGGQPSGQMISGFGHSVHPLHELGKTLVLKA